MKGGAVMFYDTHSFRAILIFIAAAFFLLYTNSFAEESNNNYVDDGSFVIPLKNKKAASNEALGLSLGLRFQERNDFILDDDYSRFGNRMDPLGFMGLDESSGPSTTAALKHALSEFQFLRGVKRAFDGAEERFVNYEKRMKLKGEILVSGRASREKAKEQEGNLEAGVNTQEKGTFKSWLFNHKFMPGKVSWKFGLDPNDELVTGKFLIGDYVSIEGNTGERTDVFLMFRYEF
jgi:hypothetical protein